MNTSNESLQHRELTEKIIGLFYEVYNELGFGFLESVYLEAMSIVLTEAGLQTKRQYPVPVWFRNRKIGDFKADLLVEEKIILELKAVRSLDLAFEKQLLNYLRGTHLEVGLILNFGPKPEFKRLAFSNERKSISVYPRKSAAKNNL